MKRILLCFISLFTIGVYAHEQGDTIKIENTKFVLTASNLISNPGFEDGLTEWTDATSTASQLSSSKFKIVETEGVDNSKYLVGITSSGSTSSGSIGTGWAIEAGKTYYFSFNVKYQNASVAAGSDSRLKISLANDKTSSEEPLKLIDETLINGSGEWTTNAIIFTNSSPSYSYIMARFRWLGNRLGFDNFSLHEAVEIIDTAALQKQIKKAQMLYDPTANSAEELQTAIEVAQALLSSQSGAEVEQGIKDIKGVIYTYTLANASTVNPLDFTRYILNPSFESSFDGWNNLGLVTQTNTAFPKKEGDTYTEKWVNRGSKVPNVSVQQHITDIPNGKYILIASAGNIQQTTSGSTVNNSSTPQTGASIFAGINETVVNAIKDYSVRFIVVDNQINIGFKAENATGNWVTCDNFRLQYIGESDVDDYAFFVKDFVDEATSLLSLKVSNAIIDSLNASITLAQNAIAATPRIYSDLEEAKNELDNAISLANVSIQAYVSLQEEIDYATKVVSWYPDDQIKKDKLQIAIGLANADYNNLDLTLSDINKSAADLNTVVKSEDKKVYIPTWMMGDVNDKDNNWSNVRSQESKNWILFWEPGFGDNPGVTVNECLALAEKCFDYYADSLKFISKGSSKTDTYKMIIRLRYTTDWEASGSGVDNTIGLLTLTPSALSSRGGQTIAHEVGHCFQYQVHCDNNDLNGWMYGYGSNASGGNGWWEQCAQWQAFKVFPSQQFNSEWLPGYLNNTHKHPIHESPRYNNYFIQDYWCQLHGNDIIGRLWNESIKPEDPIEAYKRIAGISQSQFNDEMFVCATRFASWDITRLKSLGANKITSRTQPKMNDVGNDYWMIDPSVCPENYGHNIIKINVPGAGKTVTAYFEGKVGADGYRTNYLDKAGWRIGFVAQKSDGIRVYSDLKSVTMTQNTGKESVSFVRPDNCIRLWFIVSGAPSEHWRHAWDDNDSNDEQWPYQVKFNNTNLYGHTNVTTSFSELINQDISLYSIENRLVVEKIPSNAKIMIYDLVGTCVLVENINTKEFSTTLLSGIYIVRIESNHGTITRKVLIQ